MMTKNILILGGTREARQLADHAAKAGWSAVFSLAGITATPFKTPLPMRYGGFGGAKGLAEWVVSHAITHLADTTHPYA
ncbi:MAG: precorrin-6A/cobalt-precorrin-6A reductase, partial [Candidatus Puniceispirillales bacterium]